MDRKFRLPRIWSNEELRRVAPLFYGSVVTVSAWEDSDKQGGKYRDYFCNAKSYSITNFGGTRGSSGDTNEIELDLCQSLPEFLVNKFDTVFNHTTLEHIFDTQKSFKNLCAMTRDCLITVVPFAQVEHKTDSFQDYWRFTPDTMHELFNSNGLEVVYESANTHKNSGIYLFHIGTRNPDKWRNKFPDVASRAPVGDWIGRNNFRSISAQPKQLLGNLFRKRSS